MSAVKPIVFVVDDDDEVRDALRFLLDSVGQESRLYASGMAFLEDFDPDAHGCIVSDIRMPGMSGLELQQALKERGIATPIIFITGHGDIPMAVDAIKSGAQEFLTKPFRDQTLLDAINNAIAEDASRRDDHEQRSEYERRKESLTRREGQVLELVLAGNTNKAIAEALHLSHRTIEVHRANMMDKMGAGSLAELLTLASAANATPGDQARR
jgi:FixJ family two-component response regulator